MGSFHNSLGGRTADSWIVYGNVQPGKTKQTKQCSYLNRRVLKSNGTDSDVLLFLLLLVVRLLFLK